MSENTEMSELKIKTLENTMNIKSIAERMDSYHNDTKQQNNAIKELIKEDNESLLNKVTLAFRAESQILAEGLKAADKMNADDISNVEKRVANLEGNQKWILIIAAAIGSVVARFLERLF